MHRIQTHALENQCEQWKKRWTETTPSHSFTFTFRTHLQHFFENTHVLSALNGWRAYTHRPRHRTYFAVLCGAIYVLCLIHMRNYHKCERIKRRLDDGGDVVEMTEMKKKKFVINYICRDFNHCLIFLHFSLTDFIQFFFRHRRSFQEVAHIACAYIK